MSAPWDALVVGGGTAGIVSAKTAASFGARVLLVDRERTGGDCLWTGCVPVKASLAAASVAARAKTGGSVWASSVDGLSVDFAAVMAHVHSAIRTIEPVDSPAALEAAGVHVKHGDVTFTGIHTATVNGRPLEFHQAIICADSPRWSPRARGWTGWSRSPVTPSGIDVLPERLAVIGGGNIGCELGQAFARLGAQVTIVEGDDRILGREDSKAAELVHRSLVRDGATVVTGTHAKEVRSGDGTHVLVLDDGRQVDFGRVLVSVGRSPGTRDLSLDRTGVEPDEPGYVSVDRHLRITSPDVWAGPAGAFGDGREREERRAVPRRHQR